MNAILLFSLSSSTLLGAPAPGYFLSLKSSKFVFRQVAIFRTRRIRLTFWPITRPYGKMYEAFVSGLEFEMLSISSCPV